MFPQTKNAIEISQHAFNLPFRHIHAYSGIFRYIQTYSESVRTYSRPLLNIEYSKSKVYSKTVTYLEFWYIQNPGILRTRGIFRNLAYLEPEAYSET